MAIRSIERGADPFDADSPPVPLEFNNEGWRKKNVVVSEAFRQAVEAGQAQGLQLQPRSAAGVSAAGASAVQPGP